MYLPVQRSDGEGGSMVKLEQWNRGASDNIIYAHGLVGAVEPT